MTEPTRLPADDEPGGQSTPRDTAGDGPVGLEDRTSTDEKGSPGSNQSKAEPMPPTPGHREPSAPLTPPTLDEMTVGADDPQRPSLGGGLAGTGPGAAPTDLSGPGVAPFETRPTVDGTAPTGTDRGPERPLSTTPGVSHRAPGLQGETSPAEQVGTDVDRSAEEMVRDTGRPAGAGDVHDVPVPSETPSPGTSQEHGVVQGARIPGEEPRPAT